MLCMKVVYYAMYEPRGTNIAREIIERSIVEGRKFLVYYDPDIDGLIAGYLASKYLSKSGVSYKYYINENREHGFKIEKERLNGYTVIAVDFLMSKEEVQEMVNNNVWIINIDHHDNGYSELINIDNKGVIINNQYTFEPEQMRFQSGAGMVFLTLGSIDKNEVTEENIALVGITLLSDIRPIENDEARKFLSVTYTSRSPMIKYLIDITKGKTYGFGEQRMDINFIEYTFSPKFNALFRLNKGYEAIDAVLHKNCNAIDFNACREKQNNIITDIMQNLRGVEGKNIIVKFIDEDKLKIEDVDISNFIGVACSRVAASGKTTFLFVRKDGKLKRGSVRGKKDGVDYLSIFREFGCNGSGHKNAFGVLNCNLENLDIEALNRRLEIEERKDEYEGRIINVQNLSVWAQLNNKAIAMKNIFSRGMNRIYLKYCGELSKVKKVEYGKKGKAWGYFVDGIEVKCFDADINLENGFIMPFIDRGYISYYLRKLNI